MCCLKQLPPTQWGESRPCCWIWMRILMMRTHSMIDGSNMATKELAKCLLATWRWMAKVSTMPLCPPVPTVLNIRQFLDKCPKGRGYCTPWLLVNDHALQCVGGATEGRMWHPSGMCFTPQISLFIESFIE